MAAMWLHFLNILGRIIHGMPVLVSSNWAAWILGIATFALTELLLFMRTAQGERWNKLKGNLLLGLFVTLFVYTTLFVWSTLQTTYDDHHDSVGRWRAVVKEKDKLKTLLHQKDEYIKSLEAKTCPVCATRAAKASSSPKTIWHILSTGVSKGADATKNDFLIYPSDPVQSAFKLDVKFTDVLLKNPVVMIQGGGYQKDAWALPEKNRLVLTIESSPNVGPEHPIGLTLFTKNKSQVIGVDCTNCR